MIYWTTTSKITTGRGKKKRIYPLFWLLDLLWLKFQHFRSGYTRSSFDLNVAACRLILDIVPGLEPSALQDIDGLMKLYQWAESAEQPLQVLFTKKWVKIKPLLTSISSIRFLTHCRAMLLGFWQSSTSWTKSQQILSIGKRINLLYQSCWKGWKISGLLKITSAKTHLQTKFLNI